MEKYECDNIQISNFKCIIGWTYLIDLNNSELGKEGFDVSKVIEGLPDKVVRKLCFHVLRS